MYRMRRKKMTDATQQTLVTETEQKPGSRLNMDTGLLKIIAILSMTIDHVGYVLLPDVGILRWIGRLALPIFAYCLMVGLEHTRSVKKYLARLLIMAVIAQPLFLWSFFSEDIRGNLFYLNTLFTLFLGLYAMWGFKEKKWGRFLLGFILLGIIPCDYGLIALVYMMIFYLCKDKPLLTAGLVMLYNIKDNYLLYNVDHPMYINVGPIALFVQYAAVLSLLPICIRTNTGIRLPKWFFYVFYPLHLLVICLIRQFL